MKTDCNTWSGIFFFSKGHYCDNLWNLNKISRLANGIVYDDYAREYSFPENSDSTYCNLLSSGFEKNMVK